MLEALVDYDKRTIEFRGQLWYRGSSDEQRELFRQATREGLPLHFKLPQDRSSYDERIQAFEDNLVRTAYEAEGGLSLITRVLSGLTTNVRNAPAGEVPQKLRQRANNEQRRTLELIAGGSPVVYQQAPAGTGKSFTLALAAQLMGEGEVVLFTAPTNNAVINLAEAVLKADQDDFLACDTFGKSVVVVVSSLGMRSVVDAQTTLWRDLTLAEQCRRAQAADLFRGENGGQHAVKQVDRYIRLKDEGGYEPAGEVYAFSELTKHFQPRCIFMTTAMAEIMAEHLKATTRIFADEAGQISRPVFLGLAPRLPALQQLVVTGDKFQLPPFNDRLPGDLLQHSGESIVDFLDGTQGAAISTLVTSYRSPRALTRPLQAAFYRNFNSGVPDSQRVLLSGSNVQLPVDQMPLVLVHVPELEEKQPVGTSRLNKAQTDAAEKVTGLLRDGLPPAGEVIHTTIYAAQLDHIRERLSGRNVKFATIDSFQGKESEVVVLTLTRSVRANANQVRQQKRFKFAMDARRACVALSRAREGMFIIGNLQMFLAVDGYGQYLREAANETPVVDVRYLDLAADPTSRYYELERGVRILATSSGEVPLAEGFDSTLNAKWIRLMQAHGLRPMAPAAAPREPARYGGPVFQAPAQQAPQQAPQQYAQQPYVQQQYAQQQYMQQQYVQPYAYPQFAQPQQFAQAQQYAFQQPQLAPQQPPQYAQQPYPATSGYNAQFEQRQPAPQRASSRRGRGQGQARPPAPQRLPHPGSAPFGDTWRQ